MMPPTTQISSSFTPPPLDSVEETPVAVTQSFVPPPVETAEQTPDERGFFAQRRDSLARGIAKAEQFANVLGLTTAALSSNRADINKRFIEDDIFHKRS